MENASKALIIAGEILIAVLILSLAIYLISSYRSTADTYYETISAQEIEKFNSQFLKYIEYEGVQSKISAENLITISNLANAICQELPNAIVISFEGKRNEEIQKYIIESNPSKYYESRIIEGKTVMKMKMYNVTINYADNGCINIITAN